MSKYRIPGVSEPEQISNRLNERLAALIDLGATLKHVHWNVAGPGFISIHKMLDPQVDSVRAMADETAERIATLGGVPEGTPGAVVKNRSWEDYPLGKATVVDHLEELEKVYAGVIESHRKAQQELAENDPVSEDLIIGQLSNLELYHWFVSAHLDEVQGES